MRRLEANDTYTPIERPQILATIRSAFGAWIGGDERFSSRVHVVDTNGYRGITKNWVLDYIKGDAIISSGPKQGNPEIFDCDDFVMYLKTQLALYAFSNQLRHPLAVGIIVMPEHALSFCIEAASIVHLIDVHSPKQSAASTPEQIALMLGTPDASNRAEFLYI
jgi:hypothetical protein